MTKAKMQLYFLPMFTRNLVTITILANAMIGHLCMMPMAYAEAMPTQHDEAMEMIMTPMQPMSPAHCEHCAHVAKENPNPMNTGCAGHCLSKDNTAVSSVSSGTRSVADTAVVPPSFPLVLAFVKQSQNYTVTHAPPVGFPPAHMMVMLQ